MTEIVNVTITAPDAGWLRAITRRLIELELAAAGNVSEGLISVYRWAGDVHEAVEAVSSLRTQRCHVQAIEDLVTAEHPYEVPHIVAVPVVEISVHYRQWIIDSTGGPQR